MAHFGAQAVVLDEGIEVVVRKLRIQLSRQHYRAKHICVEHDPNAIELRAKKRMVKARVMRHHQASRKSSRQSGGYFLEDRRRDGIWVLCGAATPAKSS